MKLVAAGARAAQIRPSTRKTAAEIVLASTRNNNSSRISRSERWSGPPTDAKRRSAANRIPGDATRRDVHSGRPGSCSVVTPSRETSPHSVTSPARIVRAGSSRSGSANVRANVGVTPRLPPCEPGVSARLPATVHDEKRNPQRDAEQERKREGSPDFHCSAPPRCYPSRMQAAVLAGARLGGSRRSWATLYRQPMPQLRLTCLRPRSAPNASGSNLTARAVRQTQVIVVQNPVGADTVQGHNWKEGGLMITYDIWSGFLSRSTRHQLDTPLADGRLP